MPVRGRAAGRAGPAAGRGKRLAHAGVVRPRVFSAGAPHRTGNDRSAPCPNPVPQVIHMLGQLVKEVQAHHAVGEVEFEKTATAAREAIERLVRRGVCTRDWGRGEGGPAVGDRPRHSRCMCSGGVCMLRSASARGVCVPRAARPGPAPTPAALHPPNAGGGLAIQRGRRAFSGRSGLAQSDDQAAAGGAGERRLRACIGGWPGPCLECGKEGGGGPSGRGLPRACVACVVGHWGRNAWVGGWVGGW